MNWEQHFRAMRPRSPKPTVDFGADFGEIPFTRDRSVAELRDIIAHHDYTIKQTNDAFNKIATAPPIGTAEWVKWIEEWSLLHARYQNMRKAALEFADRWSPFPENLTPAEPLYVAIQQTIQKTYPEPRTSPGDLVDLVGRAMRMGAKADFSDAPQPRRDSDAEMNILRGATEATKGIEAFTEGAAEGLTTLTGKAAAGVGKGLLGMSAETLIMAGLVIVGLFWIGPKLMGFTPMGRLARLR
jgi:hypothetical protein